MDYLTAAGIFAGLVACLELWYFVGLRVRRRRGEPLDQLSNIQGATLGLLALLLGFSFALAAGRFSERVHLIVEEANAIGTAWLRCDLLPDAQCDGVRKTMKLYLAQRVMFYDASTTETQEASLKSSTAFQLDMWSGVSSVVKSKPELANALFTSFNNMFDLQSTRAAAAERHMPLMLMILLLACSAVSVASVGYGCGVAGKRNIVLTTSMAFLISGTLWAIFDMDHPRKGLIRVGQKPMIELQKNLERELPIPSQSK